MTDFQEELNKICKFKSSTDGLDSIALKFGKCCVFNENLCWYAVANNVID